MVIDRAFLRTPEGLIHYRRAGSSAGKTPLIMAHGGPGSSLGLVPLIADLAEDREVAAPDMMGNGDSDPPRLRPTSIAFYAEGLLKIMDHLGLETADLYGHHTGAQVIAEFAIAHPGRVRRLVLDGVALLSADVRAEFLTQYAPNITPDADGAHMAWIWDFVGQTTQHFPHYRRDEAHKIVGGAALPPPLLTDRVAEVLKVWSTYHLAYQAAFTHEFAERMPLISASTLVLEVANDPLALYAPAAAALIPRATCLATDRQRRGEAIRDFLDA
jgi:pimeloyl-ACP methyl ester carboxylesterase